MAVDCKPYSFAGSDVWGPVGTTAVIPPRDVSVVQFTLCLCSASEAATDKRWIMKDLAMFKIAASLRPKNQKESKLQSLQLCGSCGKILQKPYNAQTLRGIGTGATERLINSSVYVGDLH